MTDSLRSLIGANQDGTMSNCINGVLLGSNGGSISDQEGSLVIGGTNSNINGFGTKYNGILAGEGNTISNSSNNFIGGSYQSSITGSNYSHITSSQSSIIGEALGGSIIGGYTNTINKGSYSTIFGGENNTIQGVSTSGTADRSNSIFNSINGSISVNNGGDWNSIYSSRDSYITTNTGDHNAIISSYNAHITGTTSSNHNIIIGGTGGWIDLTTGDRNMMIGGLNGWITGTTQSGSMMIGGSANTLLTTTNSVLLGSQSSQITSGSNSLITASLSSSLSALTAASMISASGRTGLYNYTLHTDNIHTYKTKSFDVVNAGAVSGSIDVDLSLGTLFYFEMTGNTTPNFINWREGQQIQFWVFNNGSHNVPTITISGGGSVYAKAGAVNPTNNERTGYYGTIVNGDMYLDEHLNFQAL